MASNSDKSKRDEEIDANLKRVFQEQLEEDIPDRFKALLDQLKHQDQGKGSSNEK